MKTKLSILAFALIIAAGCTNKMFREAEKRYGNYEFATAARLYENYLKNDSDKTAMLHLADCYRQMNRHGDAEKWYARAIGSQEATATDKLHYAEVLKENGKYEQAQTLFSAYLAAHPDDRAAANQLLSCDSAKQLFPNPFYEVEILEFGFAGSCFSPVRIGNDLLVTAEAPVKTGEPVNNWTGQGFLGLYIVSEKTGEPLAGANGTNGSLPAKEWVVTPLPGTVNTGLHEGPAAVAPDGNVLYFTRSNVSGDEPGKAKNDDNHLELCAAELVNGSWTNVSSMPFNSLEYSCGHPAITGDGNRLYFISDRPGGYGGTDIYYSDRVGGNWSAPANAGSTINTNGNEMFPTIRQVVPGTDELYFSSDGLPGAGGLDLFRCAVSGGTLGTPERMPFPFNASGDDFGILFDENGTGYFSSNRGAENGVDKIYSFRRKSPAFFVDLVVLDKETRQPVPNTVVEVFVPRLMTVEEKVTDSTGHLVFAADSMTTYGFTLRCVSYFCGFSSAFTGGFEGKLYDTTYHAIDIEKIVINKPIRLENIYYDYNKWNIRPEAAVELDKLVKLMTDNPQIRIELSSHTDSRGSDNYNMKLSQKRAQSAVDYIVSKGVSRDRIYAKGYGESAPLNKCVNGVKCTEEEFQWNRRTEFKVVKIVE
jgi:peptidoglycan-associated lipoprotein